MMKYNDILPGGRLTTDDPTNNTQTMLNYAYAKDGRVFLRYGDGEEDIDLCEYISREAAGKHCRPTPEEIMDGACLECDCPLAILYVVATQAAELRARLKEYEDTTERHTPKRPEFWGDGYDENGELIYDNAKCPNCGNDDFEEGINNWGCKFCPDCGQALDWGEAGES